MVVEEEEASRPKGVVDDGRYLCQPIMDHTHRLRVSSAKRSHPPVSKFIDLTALKEVSSAKRS
eukprot:10104714-Karenia_brevis.AAC.1